MPNGYNNNYHNNGHLTSESEHIMFHYFFAKILFIPCALVPVFDCTRVVRLFMPLLARALKPERERLVDDYVP